MDEQDFIKERVDNQIDWYDKKSQWNQNWYKRLRILEIFTSLLIPFIAGYISINVDIFKILVGIPAIVVAMIASLLNIYKFQENWIEYRTTTESLRHEKFLFLTKTGPYNVEKSFPIFVERIESLISKENTNWAQYIQKEDKECKKNG